MIRFVIERAVPGAGEMTKEQLADVAETFNVAVASLGVPYTWVATYVAGDKFYCVHDAEDVEAIIEHTRRSGFAADAITAVAAEIGPHSARVGRS